MDLNNNQEPNSCLVTHKLRVRIRRPSEAGSYLAKAAADRLGCCNWPRKFLRKTLILGFSF